MKILIACEFSGIVRAAFAQRGHDAWSCDILPTEQPGNHIVGNALEYLDDGWDMLIAHPPCTYLTNAGVRHLHDHVTSKNGNKSKVSGSARWVAMFEAAEFFNAFMQSSIPKICTENPIPHKYSRALIGRYTQLIQPWQHGHGETKATCLWLKGLPNLTPSNIVEGRESRIHHMAPSKNRSKLRSITYQGIANAMASQWG
jgi:hypothetical protein